MNSDELLREQIVNLLEGGNAHNKTMEVLQNYPYSIINKRLPNVSYSPWELLEHMRIAQYDILEFVRNPDYESPLWPEGYWPQDDEETTVEKWEATFTSFWVDLSESVKLAKDPDINLYEPIKHAPDYNILRELMLIADHNAYHLAQLVLFSKTFSE